MTTLAAPPLLERTHRDGRPIWLRTEPNVGKKEPTNPDLLMFDRYSGEYDRVPIPSGVVMDCGAHIGIYLRDFLRRGATHVHAYEPDPDNLSLLRRNVAGFPVTIHSVALADRPGTFRFWHAGSDNWNHSLVKRQGAKQAIKVRAVDFWAEVEALAPAMVKLDIEAGEWALDLHSRPLPASVSVFVAEFHVTRAHWADLAVAVYAHLDAQGFSAIRRPPDRSYFGHEVGIWAR